MGSELFPVTSPAQQVDEVRSGSEAGAGTGSAAADNIVQLPASDPKGGAAAAAAVQPTGAAASPALSKADIQELVKSIGAATAATQPATQSPAQPQLTQDQLEQMFQVWKPSSDLVAQLRDENPEVAIQALATLRDGLIRQAMAMADYRVQQLLGTTKEEFTQQLSPLSEYVSEAKATAFRNDFFKANSDLEPYEQLVDAVAAKLYQSGGDGFLRLNREERMQLFADESRKLVQQLTKGGNGATAGQAGGQGQPAQQRKMSTLTGGGQPTGRSGGKPTGTGIPNVDAGLAVFD